MTTTLLASFPSPSQGVWHLGPLPIRAYALFIVAGMLAALWIGEKRWVERGGEEGAVYSVFWWAMPFGLLGGRLYHVITDWRTYFGDDGAGFLAAFRIWEGGLGIWGAVALGGVGAWIGCRRLGIPLPAFGDAVAPGIILAQGIGRLGNYFNQELYGGPTTLPWGLEIFDRTDASGAVSPHLVNGVSTGQVDQVVHPTFLYELLWNLLVFAALIYIDRRFKIGHGRLFATYVAGYCLGRFWIELMRSDAATHIAGIRINSFTATFVFIGAVVYIMVAPKGREDPATLKGTTTEAEDKAKDTEEEEETSIEEFVKELTGVAATTTGLVAAAKVAGEAEDEDAKAAADAQAEAPSEDIAEAEEVAEAKAEAEEAEAAEEEAEQADEAEELGADVAGVPADDIAEAEEFAAEGEEAPEADAETHSEAAAEAEALVEDVAEAPSEDIAEAEEFAEAKAEAEEAESVGGVGAVEGEEAVEAEEAAPEAHDAAVEAAEEAEDVAAELAAAAESVGGVGAVEGEEAVEAEEAAPEAHDAAVKAAEEAEDVAAEVTDAADDEDQQVDAESLDSGGEEAAESAESEDAAAVEVTDAAADAESVGGVGAVEGEDAVEAEVAAPEAHDAAVEAAEEAEGVAAEVSGGAADDEQQPEFDGPIEAADEAEAVEAEAAVGEAEGEPSEEEAAEVAEAVVAEAEAIEEQEPEAQVLADESEPESTDDAEPAAGEPEPANGPAEESGGRLRRWLRGRRNR